MKSVKILIASCIFGLIIGGAAPVQALDQLESQVIAAMLFNFTKYVEWPANAFISSSQSTICIVGNDSLLRTFNMYQNKISNGKTIRIKAISGSQDIGGCNLLYIDKSEQANLPEYLLQTAKKPVLTASNSRLFASTGGIIGFYIQDDRVRFEINIEEAQKSGLIFSSNLLKLARIVR
jgi:hypothetical protein